MTNSEISIAPTGQRALVDIVVPVYNEAVDLAPSIRRLRRYLDESFPFAAVITIADNASTDDTWDIAQTLSRDVVGVRAIHLTAKGRGRALRAAWLESDASVVAYMDVDLSTDLDALLPLVAPLVSHHSDVAIGSRLARGSHVVRGPKRELISRIYNVILRLCLHNKFSDAQCGFKALRSEDARILLPAVMDNEWFFDTELLVLAERNGLRIHEVPVDWSDDPDSRVHVTSTAIADLKGVWRLMRSFSAGKGRVEALHPRHGANEVSEVARFASVGIMSTVANLALYLIFRNVFAIYFANALALCLCSVANIAAHYRFTFSEREPRSRRTALLGAVGALFLSIAFTTMCLVVAMSTSSSVWTEIVALLVGNGLAGLIRFVTLRALVFKGHLRQMPTTGASISLLNANANSTPWMADLHEEEK